MPNLEQASITNVMIHLIVRHSCRQTAALRKNALDDRYLGAAQTDSEVRPGRSLEGLVLQR